jgi:hypothetical protein
LVNGESRKALERNFSHFEEQLTQQKAKNEKIGKQNDLIRKKNLEEYKEELKKHTDANIQADKDRQAALIRETLSSLTTPRAVNPNFTFDEFWSAIQQNNQAGTSSENAAHFTRRKLDEVNRKANQAKDELEQIRLNFDEPSANYIEQQITSSRENAQAAFNLATRNELSFDSAKLISQFALDTIDSVNRFLNGVGNGFYHEC